MTITLKDLKNQISPVLTKYGVSKAAVFGSFARGELKEGSDIDLLVELLENHSLFDFIAIKQEIEEKIGFKIDLVEYSSLHPKLEKVILAEQVPIL
jgi:predicted nucleotidyltransferase